jgi:hypothetical protein
VTSDNATAQLARLAEPCAPTRARTREAPPTDNLTLITQVCDELRTLDREARGAGSEVEALASEVLRRIAVLGNQLGIPHKTNRTEGY